MGILKLESTAELPENCGHENYILRHQKFQNPPGPNFSEFNTLKMHVSPFADWCGKGYYVDSKVPLLKSSNSSNSSNNLGPVIRDNNQDPVRRPARSGPVHNVLAKSPVHKGSRRVSRRGKTARTRRSRNIRQDTGPSPASTTPTTRRSADLGPDTTSLTQETAPCTAQLNITRSLTANMSMQKQVPRDSTNR